MASFRPRKWRKWLLLLLVVAFLALALQGWIHNEDVKPRKVEVSGIIFIHFQAPFEASNATFSMENDI